MALQWRPMIYNATVLTPLPRPILSLDIIDKWDYQESKVPKRAGSRVAGHSRGPRRIEVVGELAIDDGTPAISEDDQIALLAKLDLAVDIEGQERYEFFIYHKSTSPTSYRKFKSCYTDSLKVSLGDEHRSPMSYSLTILTENPTLYATAEGA